MRLALTLLLAALFSTAPARAADIARPAALDGAQYAIVFPIFNSGPNTSFLRLVNGDLESGQGASTFSVTVVGSPSGATYGTAQIVVPLEASPQYAIGDILTLAGAGALTGGDTAYSLYIQNPRNYQFYQHVIYNSDSQFFEDVSICKSATNIGGDVVVSNVHTSRLPGFPSTVYITNTLATAATYRARVVDARTGTTIGTSQNIQVGANAVVAMPFSTFETQVGWTPNENQQHANIVFRTSAGDEPDGMLVGSIIVNTALNTYLNLSNKCSVNSIQDSDGGSGTGTGPFALTVTKSGSGTGFVTSSPAGIDCGAQCSSRSFSFTGGTLVNLTAGGTAGSVFQAWGGACSGTGSCSVTMNSDQSVTASFGPVQNSLTVSIVGTGNAVSTPAGINCGTQGTQCTAAFASGTVSIQALGANSGLQNFVGWTGCASTGGNNGSLCTLSINGTQTVTATFSN